MPKLKIKRAYIEGKNYIGDKLVYGEEKNSTESMPDINQETYDYVNKIISGKEFNSDSIVDFDKYYYEDTIQNSFFGKTLVLKTDEELNLARQVIQNNVIIYSSKSVFIENSVILKDAIIASKSIIVEKGFKGTCQLFASDTIILDENVQLLYPGYAAIINEKDSVNILFEAGKNCLIAGGVLAFSKNKALKKTDCYIEEKARIYGNLFSNGMIQFKGEMYGSMACKKFILRTASSVYENHLLDAVIDFNSMPEKFAGAGFFNNSKLNIDIKCLEERIY